MPIYEYACTACGERTEACQGFDDPPLDTCENCGGKLRKLYSPVGIVFKGSGFYSTDAKKSGSSTKSKDGKSSGGDAAKSGTDKASSSNSSSSSSTSKSSTSESSSKTSSKE